MCLNVCVCVCLKEFRPGFCKRSGRRRGQLCQDAGQSQEDKQAVGVDVCVCMKEHKS